VAYQYRLPSHSVPDLLQELRIALWRVEPGIDVNATWLVRTAEHKAQDFWRRFGRIVEQRLESGGIRDQTVGLESELLHLLRARVSLLPAYMRRFYRLRFLEGLSQREISSRLGICRSSVRYLERRCYKMVMGRLPAEPATVPDPAPISGGRAADNGIATVKSGGGRP
jgi:RNA polymerase sigma factor (sigma-70 family)